LLLQQKQVFALLADKNVCVILGMPLPYSLITRQIEKLRAVENNPKVTFLIYLFQEQ